jgi:hypothetical protein
VQDNALSTMKLIHSENNLLFLASFSFYRFIHHSSSSSSSQSWQYSLVLLTNQLARLLKNFSDLQETRKLLPCSVIPNATNKFHPISLRLISTYPHLNTWTYKLSLPFIFPDQFCTPRMLRAWPSSILWLLVLLLGNDSVNTLPGKIIREKIGNLLLGNG